MAHFIYPEVTPGTPGGVPADGSPTITASTPANRQYDATTLKAVQLPTFTATGTGTLTVTFTCITESGAFSLDGENGEYTDGELEIEGTLEEVNNTMAGDLWFKPAAGSQNTIAYKVTITDDQSRTGDAGDPLQVVNSNLYTKGKKASALITLAGDSGSITLLVQGQPICADVPYTTSLEGTVDALVTAITKFSGVPKYAATKVGTNQIKIEAPLSYGELSNGFQVTAKATGTMSISGDSKLTGGVKEVKAPAGWGDTIKDFVVGHLPEIAGVGLALGAGLLLRNMSQVQAEVPVSSSDENPQISVLYDCQTIPVPTGYTPAILSDDGLTWTAAVMPATWDYVTFTDTPMMCYNPAICLLELVKNKRWGAGNSIVMTADQQLRFNQQVWNCVARCDEMVSSGNTSSTTNTITQEPRYAINTLIINMTQKDALDAVASCFDAQIIYADNGIHLKADMPDSPKRVVTNANVGAGDFHFSGGSLNALYNTVEVQYNNPAKYYNLEKVWEFDIPSQIKFGEKKDSVHAFGCASAGQARRKARYIMLNSQSDPAMVSYVAGFDHYDLIPGDLVTIVDNSVPAIGSIRKGGRLSSVTSATVLVLDRLIDLPDTGGYISISMPNDTVESKKVLSKVDNGNRSTVTVESAFSTNPQAQWVWVYTEQTAPDAVFKIVSKNERSVGAYEITAISHDGTIYAKMDDI